MHLYMKYEPATIDAHETTPITIDSIPDVAIAIIDVIIEVKRNEDGIAIIFQIGGKIDFTPYWTYVKGITYEAWTESYINQHRKYRMH